MNNLHMHTVLSWPRLISQHRKCEKMTNEELERCEHMQARIYSFHSLYPSWGTCDVKPINKTALDNALILATDTSISKAHVYPLVTGNIVFEFPQVNGGQLAIYLKGDKMQIFEVDRDGAGIINTADFYKSKAVGIASSYMKFGNAEDKKRRRFNMLKNSIIPLIASSVIIAVIIITIMALTNPGNIHKGASGYMSVKVYPITAYDDSYDGIITIEDYNSWRDGDDGTI